jgi:ABC-type iron transport system FetAB permease component
MIKKFPLRIKPFSAIIQSLAAGSWLLTAGPAHAYDTQNQVFQLCDLEYVFRRLLQVGIGLAGLALFVMFILGSYKWITAGANEKAAQEAKGTFTTAVAGFALFIFAWFILRFIQEFTGIQVTVFSIPAPDIGCPAPPGF